MSSYHQQENVEIYEYTCKLLNKNPLVPIVVNIMKDYLKKNEKTYFMRSSLKLNLLRFDIWYQQQSKYGRYSLIRCLFNLNKFIIG